MYLIKLTNKWTSRSIIYPEIYNNEVELDKGLSTIPYSNKYWTTTIIQIA